MRVVDLLTLAVAAGTAAGLRAADRATQPEQPLTLTSGSSVYKPGGKPRGCWKNVRGGIPCGAPPWREHGSGLCERHVEEMRQW
jgi:hypothetical protein